ncbi:olfactory receptor 8U9-like [Microcaecilia unicolor]|uniref:Olfactory receptor n=1 Tax=Microcaecilia unicolor TaxID=1415580 RepID=A0A6P7X048_9AMPH|nr:olfactory receptor 8U9-like [Microcaecilia unicolor]
MVNHTSVTEFLILGFPEFPELQIPLFILFSFLYLMALLGNLLIICIVCADRQLHIPMYFFLTNLSALDICSLTSIVPKMLTVLLAKDYNISFVGCILQTYCYMMCISTEFILLTAMAFDRYVAICNPLRYLSIMNKRICVLLAAASWITGLLEPLPHTIVLSRFPFCDSNIINHFFCETAALVQLSCSDTSTIQTMNYILGIFVLIIPFLLTQTSYMFIISTILKIHSSKGKSKAFSTCSSHLTVIILAYGTMIGVYIHPGSMDAADPNKLPIAMYIVTTPLLNPLIYSLRSRELKMALKKVHQQNPLKTSQHCGIYS